MKYIYSEGPNYYSNYLFSYQVFAIREETDTAEAIYNLGFLPVRSIKNLYYLARSCRINLADFSLSSENRRAISKYSDLIFEFKNLEDFHLNNIEEIKGEKNFIDNIGLKRIFSKNGNYNFVALLKNTQEEIQALAVLYLDKQIVHYAHSFYKDIKLGMPLMSKVVNWAKNNGLKYVYLGTLYGKNSLYKIQYKGFEFFDGISWTKEVKKLEYLTARDGLITNKHLWQDSKYLHEFYREEKLGRLIKKLQNEKK